jgi:hypothetical protein
MINEKILEEKLKYLITVNAKSQKFDIMKIYIEFEYIDQERTKLLSYDIDITFDYQGGLEFEVEAFSYDIRRMTHKLTHILDEYVINSDGKIVSKDKSNCFSLDPVIYRIEYKVDETHIFELGYKFNYAED